MMTTKRNASAPLPKLRGVTPITLGYDRAEHRSWPHVVKFSGGRSSALLLFGLLYGRQLRPSRGDVIVFNNTSAEHPATYAFAAICKRIAEERFNIPFFWTEFQTYEDARRGQWRRLPSYRMVLPHHYTKKRLRGYRRQGEVFEELISWKQTLPTRFARTCTEYMKLHTTARFLEDWFGRLPTDNPQSAKSSSRHLGHWYDTSQMVLTAYRDRQEIARYHLEQPHTRQRQRFQDFTGAKLGNIRNRNLTDKALDRVAPLKGDGHVEFLSLVGLRADEPRRVARVLERNNVVTDVERLADGEYVYAPLFEMSVGKTEVFDFWANQSWDLAIPHDINLSNCVYCFMKGERALREIAANEGHRKRRHNIAPQNIAWWADIERRYARVRPTRDTPGSFTQFGFFGANRLAYDEIIHTRQLPPEQVAPSALPCDCTD